MADRARSSRVFQSTLPVWGATREEVSSSFTNWFQSTLPVWGATEPQSTLWSLFSVSIHAPRVGSDWLWGRRQGRIEGFQSTLPVWGATLFGKVRKLDVRFQSTLPVWGATLDVTLQYADEVFQSTLPVWGATLAFDFMSS